jgi:DNA-binding MarR family transcriptional regulator
MRTDDTTEAADEELASRLRLLIARLARQQRQRSIGGLTPSQYSALVGASVMAPVRLGDLAAREGVTPPTLSRIVGGLEEAELVARQPDPADGRCSLIAPTDHGLRVLDMIRQERTALLADRLRTMAPADRRQIADAIPVLEQLLEDLRPVRPGATEAPFAKVPPDEVPPPDDDGRAVAGDAKVTAGAGAGA